MSRYDTVEQTRPLTGLGSFPDDDTDLSPTSQKWLEYSWRKLNALLWVTIAISLVWYLQLLEVIIDGRASYRPNLAINRFFFNIGLAAFSSWLCIAAYLIVWLKYIKRISMEWEDYSPRAIPAATAAAVTSLISFCVAFWPIWGILSIPLVFVLFLGALNLAHFVPF